MKDITQGATRRNMLMLALESAQSAQASSAAMIAILKAELAVDQAEGAKVYGLDEMAERRNLSANTLRSWARDGRLKCSSGARKQYLCTDAAVDAALAAEVPPRTSLRKTEPTDDGDALQDALQSGELVRGAR